MSVTPAIISQLLSISTITDLVGSRIGRDQAPSTWASNYPYIVVHSESSQRDYSGSGTVCPIESEVDVELFAENAAQADTIQDAITADDGGFNLQTWTAKGVTIDRLMVTSESYNTSPEVGGKNHREYRRLIPCTVFWRNAT